MFRKTFICAAGIVAGVSAGAYSDGFFNEKNVVTDTYQQTMQKMGFASSTPATVSMASSAEVPAEDNADMQTAFNEAAQPASEPVPVRFEQTGVTDNEDRLRELELPSSVAASTPASIERKAPITNQSTTPRAPRENSIIDQGDESGRTASEDSATDAKIDELQRTLEKVAKALEKSAVDSGKQVDDDAAAAIAALAAEAESAARAANLKQAELKRKQEELATRRAEEKQRQMEVRRKQAELARLEAEQARIKAEEDRMKAEATKAQALVDQRFSKEVYESSTGEQLPYRKLVPKSTDDNELKPLVLFLHGKGERGSDNQLQLKHGMKLFASDKGMKAFPAIVIAPQCPDDQLWADTLLEKDDAPKMRPKPTSAMRLVIELLDEIQLTDPVDPDRIYITGLSMGGFGTFDLVARRPGVFAAAAPLCGGGDASPGIIRRLTRTPWWVVHGADDRAVNVNRSREMVYALESAGAAPRYSELEGFGHNVWDAAYSDIMLYDWMFNQSRSGVINPVLERSQINNATANNRTSTRETTNTAAASKAIASVKPDRTPVSVTTEPQTSVSRKKVNPQLEPLLGTWKVLAASQKGQQASKKVLSRMQVIFEQDRFVIQIGDRQEIAKFKLSDSKKVRQIDILSNREGIKDSAGIYELRGDKLIMCWAEPGRPRPTRFVNFINVKSLVLQKQ